MCSFLWMLHDHERIERANWYAQSCGPDNTKMIKVDGMIFVHNLLDISGAEPTYQPVVSYEHSIVLLYNGEIYNYENIVSAYLEHGHNFANHLDGEFAIVLIDLKANQLIYATDVFMMRHLFVAIDENQEIIGVATCASMLVEAKPNLTVYMANPNEIVVVDLNSKRACHRMSPNLKQDVARQLQDFDLLDAWQTAFEKSIKMRIPKVPFFVCLSSGYNSGAICLALNRSGCEYTTVSCFKGEDEEVLKQRIRTNAMMSYGIGFNSPDYAKPWNKVEPMRLQDDDGVANRMNAIGGFMRELGHKVTLSSLGATDGFKTSRLHMLREEIVHGAHGIECRYPFLDVEVNAHNNPNRALIIAYLKRYDYPVQ